MVVRVRDQPDQVDPWFTNLFKGLAFLGFIHQILIVQIVKRQMNSSRTRPAERELRAFVSSLMVNDLKPYRKAVIEILNEMRVLSPWIFEFTPASSEPLDESYLRHVRDADVVIWIGGEETTTPVVREINEAIKETLIKSWR